MSGLVLSAVIFVNEKYLCNRIALASMLLTNMLRRLLLGHTVGLLHVFSPLNDADTVSLLHVSNPLNDKAIFLA